MFTYEFVIAAAVITAPGDIVDTARLRPWFLPLRSALVRVAVAAEIMDRREEPLTMLQEDRFPADVTMLQNRFQEFLNAPLLEECRRFPDRNLVCEFLTVNRAYRSDLIARLLVDAVHGEDLRNAIQETDQLFNVWDSIRDARCEYYYITVRRQSLVLLRQLAGNEAFYSGQLPPHVPTWRFAGN